MLQRSTISRRRKSRSSMNGSPSIEVIFSVLLVVIHFLHQPDGIEGFQSMSLHGAMKRNRVVLATNDRIGNAIDKRYSQSFRTKGLAASTSNLLFNTDTWVFIAGIFPFMWATYEFWRRIMFGESFGTGNDRVIIGIEDSPKDSRGTRVLGRGALITAYVLFVCAFGTLAVVGYSVATSEAPTEEALAAVAAAASGAASGGDLSSL